MCVEKEWTSGKSIILPTPIILYFWPRLLKQCVRQFLGMFGRGLLCFTHWSTM